jgi:hypothetical protein
LGCVLQEGKKSRMMHVCCDWLLLPLICLCFFSRPRLGAAVPTGGSRAPEEGEKK